MFSQKLIQRAEAIVFENDPAFIVGLAADLKEISEEDWEMYIKNTSLKEDYENKSLTFVMFVLASEGML